MLQRIAEAGNKGVFLQRTALSGSKAGV